MEENKVAEKGEFCDVCGTNMTDETGYTMIGITIQVEGDHKEIHHVEKVFGKTDFKICYACWLKSLGVKEK